MDVCLKGISRGDPFIDVISCVLVVPLSFESLINSKFPRIREILVLGLMEEILHQLISSLSVYTHYLQGFIHPKWLFGISSPSTVSSPLLVYHCDCMFILGDCLTDNWVEF